MIKNLSENMFYLDYFDHPPHFASHNIVACGFDENSVFVADTNFKETQKVSIDNSRKQELEALGSGIYIASF